MSSAKSTKHADSASFSSQKKKTYDRFIPHSMAKNLFNTPASGMHHNHYQELLNSNLLTQQTLPKILLFHDHDHPKENNHPNLPSHLQ